MEKIQIGICNCIDQTGGYYGSSKLKKKLVKNLEKKYNNTCKNCGKPKSHANLPPKKRHRYDNFPGCKGECHLKGGCGPLCLAPLLIIEDLEPTMLTSQTGNGNSLKLIKITKSTHPDKKLMAIFEKNGRKKVVHFGATGMSDYHLHKDPERKKRYLLRHAKRENWNDPTSAGSLSRYILWNKTSLRASIDDYKKRFHF